MDSKTLRRLQLETSLVLSAGVAMAQSVAPFLQPHKTTPADYSINGDCPSTTVKKSQYRVNQRKRK